MRAPTLLPVRLMVGRWNLTPEIDVRTVAGHPHQIITRWPSGQATVRKSVSGAFDSRPRVHATQVQRFARSRVEGAWKRTEKRAISLIENDPAERNMMMAAGSRKRPRTSRVHATPSTTIPRLSKSGSRRPRRSGNRPRPQLSSSARPRRRASRAGNRDHPTECSGRASARARSSGHGTLRGHSGRHHAAFRGRRSQRP